MALSSMHPALKLLVIAVLTLLLLIPTAFITHLVHKRQQEANEAKESVQSSWSKPQVLAGPIISIPYERRVYKRNDDGEIEYQYKKSSVMHYLPDSLAMDVSCHSHTRKRGIFETVVSDASLDISGTFVCPPVQGDELEQVDMLIANATVTFLLTDLKGLRQVQSISLNGADVQLVSGSGLGETTCNIQPDWFASNKYHEIIVQSSITAPLPFDPTAQTVTFDLPLQLNTGEELLFYALGRNTDVKLAADWPHPSFIGEYLPQDHTITSNGFSASWHVSSISRGVPQQLQDGANLGNSAFGVRFMQPVNHYSKVNRSVKYAILIIFLTFISFFFCEVLTKRSVHIIQYLLVGFAIVLFFLLLLSLTEHIIFTVAYIVAAVATIGLIVLYSRTVLASGRLAARIGLVLSSVYTYMYVILHLEDYALLVGSIGLFVTLSIIMYITRTLDWDKPFTGEGDPNKLE